MKAPSPQNAGPWNAWFQDFIRSVTDADVAALVMLSMTGDVPVTIDDINALKRDATTLIDFATRDRAELGLYTAARREDFHGRAGLLSALLWLDYQMKDPGRGAMNPELPCAVLCGLAFRRDAGVPHVNPAALEDLALQATGNPGTVRLAPPLTLAAGYVRFVEVALRPGVRANPPVKPSIAFLALPQADATDGGLIETLDRVDAEFDRLLAHVAKKK